MLHRLTHYADVNARVRARLGAMPAEVAWRDMAAAVDLPNMIERMRQHGLAWWLSDLPREVDRRTLEAHLHHRAGQMLERVCGWLPASWQALRAHLRLLPLLAPLRALAGGDPVTLQFPDDSPLRDLARLEAAARHEALAESPWAPLLARDATPQDNWWRILPATMPRCRGHEARVLARLLRMLQTHSSVLGARREVMASDAAAAHDGDTRQWALRAELAQQLRELLAFGHPFHAGVVLCYGLIEALQFERMRALLVGRASGWPVHIVMGA